MSFASRLIAPVALLVAFAALPPGRASAQPALDDGPPPTPGTICQGRQIREIRVEGARRVLPDDIRASIPLRRGLPCADDEVARAAQELWDLGFFADLRFEGELVGEEIVLTITVRERPAIAKVSFEGNDEIDDEDIEEEVSLREGAILSVPDVQAQVAKIRAKYAEEGYFLARVAYEVVPTDDETEIEVRFTIDEGEEVEIRRIHYVGNRALSDEELAGVTQLQSTRWHSFITDRNSFDEEAFEQDVQIIQAYYYDKGYLQMRVGTPRVELTSDFRFIDITIPVEEGPRYRVGAMRVAEVDGSGAEQEPLEEDLRERVDLTEGDWFNRTAIATGLQDIQRTYRDAGYAYVEVSPETDLDAETRVVDIELRIVRGPPVRIERIQISGNSKTRDSVIRRELTILEGDLYSQSDIERSRLFLQRLGYFDRVDFSEERGSRPDLLVLNVEVAERSTGTFQVGAGFSSIESFILTAQIQQQNLFGNGHTLGLNVQLSGIRQTIRLNFIEPYFLGTRWGLGVRLDKNIQQFATFVQDSTGGGIFFTHPVFDRRLNVRLGYDLDYVEISDRTGGFLGTGSGNGQLFNVFRQSPLGNLFRDGLTSAISGAISWDSRNDQRFPSRGWWVRYRARVADRFLGSEQVFFEQTAFARVYRRIFNTPFVFRMNVEAGVVTSREPEGVPIFQRFRLGGIFNLRGFPLQSVGPRAAIPRTLDPNASPPREGNGFPEGIELGGNVQALYQLEIMFPILTEVGIFGVVFHDAGNTWNLERNLCEAPEATNSPRSISNCGIQPALRASVGFGLRWISPLGPLRFEWGFPIRRQSFDERFRFEFTIGTSF
ncbi:MAG: outer membrane protein assembly factor BamA [Myxococcota bacterium]